MNPQAWKAATNGGRDVPLALKNQTRAERIQEFGNLVFHGGSGLTLEMRVFSLGGIRECVAQAGFSRLEIYDRDDSEIGLCWSAGSGSHVMAAGA